MCSHCAKQYGFLEKVKIKLPHNPAIPRLDVDPEELESVAPSDRRVPTAMGALFTTAKM